MNYSGKKSFIAQTLGLSIFYFLPFENIVKILVYFAYLTSLFCARLFFCVVRIECVLKPGNTY